MERNFTQEFCMVQKELHAGKKVIITEALKFFYNKMFYFYFC